MAQQTGMCVATRQEIKNDNPGLRVQDNCPVCGVKIGFHQNEPISAGKRLRDGLPELVQTNTESHGSVPDPQHHAPCEGNQMENFHLFDIPESLWDGENTVLKKAKATSGLEYSTEADISRRVAEFVEDVIEAGDFPFTVRTDLGINRIRPDISVLTHGDRLVGVVEVKKPDETVLSEPTVVGELYDQMLLVQGFYNSGPVIGILTTLNEWRFACFPRDMQHFITSTGANFADGQFLTPVKPPVPSSSPRSSPAGETPSQKRKDWSHDILGDNTDNEAATATELTDEQSIPVMTRELFLSPILNACESEGYNQMMKYLYTSFVRMKQVRVNYVPTGVPLCYFALHKGYSGVNLTWHSRDCKAIQEMNLDSIQGNKFPRADVQKLLALEDLGRGATGKAWLMCTISSNPSICVLKFSNKSTESSVQGLKGEKESWHLIYEEFASMVKVEVWGGSTALMMPHFVDIPVNRRDEFKESIRTLLTTKFVDKGYCHPDVAWRNIGYYRRDDSDIPVIYDLVGLKPYVLGEHNDYIDSVMRRLYPSDSIACV